MYDILYTIAFWAIVVLLVLLVLFAIYTIGRVFGLGFRKSLLEARKKEVTQKHETIRTKEKDARRNGETPPRILQ